MENQQFDDYFFYYYYPCEDAVEQVYPLKGTIIYRTADSDDILLCVNVGMLSEQEAKEMYQKAEQWAWNMQDGGISFPPPSYISKRNSLKNIEEHHKREAMAARFFSSINSDTERIHQVIFLRKCAEFARQIQENRITGHAFVSQDVVDDLPRLISAASGNGNQATNLEAEQAGLEWADGAANVRIVNTEPTTDAHFIVDGISAKLSQLFSSVSDEIDIDENFVGTHGGKTLDLNHCRDGRPKMRQGPVDDFIGNVFAGRGFMGYALPLPQGRNV